MPTSIILLDQNFNPNDVELTVFELCFLPFAVDWRGNESHGSKIIVNASILTVKTLAV